MTKNQKHEFFDRAFQSSVISFKSSRGFTLIEILIVMSITAALVLSGTLSYLSLRDKKILDSMVTRIVFDLRATAERSKAQENDSGWGVHFTNGASDYYEVWNGSDYATGTKVSRINLSSVSFSDPQEGASKDIIFARATGLPLAASTISVTNSKGTKTITVNSNGRIDY